MAEDWLQPLLRDWAQWYVSALDGGSNYADATVIWRAIYSPGDLPPGSTMPKGAIPPPGLNRVQLAMNYLLPTDQGEAVRVVRCWYCLGEAKTLDELGLTRRTMYRRKGTGEAAIRRFLQA